MRSSFDKNLACIQDIINYKKDGTPFLNRLLMLPCATAKTFYYLGFQNDVTEERGLNHNNESLLKVKDGEIRHMINNPLAIIIGKLELNPFHKMDEKIEDGLIEKLQINLKKINHTARNFDSISELEDFQIT
jgi:hypothetical protein